MSDWVIDKEENVLKIKLGNDNINYVTVELHSSDDVGVWFINFKSSQCMTPDESFYYEMIGCEHTQPLSLSQAKSHALYTARCFFSYIAKCADEALTKERDEK